MLLTRATSKAVGTTLKTKADKTKLIPLKILKKKKKTLVSYR